MSEEPNSRNQHDQDDQDDQEVEADTALPPEIAALTARLTTDGALWQSRLPDAARVAERIRAIAHEPPLSAAEDSSLLTTDIGGPPESGHRAPRTDDRRRPPSGPWGRFIGLAAAVIIVALFASVLLLANSGKSTGPVAHPTQTQLAPTTTNPSLRPTPQPTVDPTQVAQACHDPSPAPVPAVLIGGLYVGSEASLSNLSYPKVQLPDGTPVRPLLVPANGPQTSDETPVNPNLSERTGGGYVLVVCNGSTQPHQVQGVVVRLDRVTPYTGQLNEWSFCAAPYTRSGPSHGAGCGGGPAEDEYVHAGFAPAAPAGAVVTTTQTPGSPSNRYGQLPWTLAPGETILIDVGLTPPTAPGSYTFAFGLTIDGAAPVFASVAPATLVAPVTHEWTGEACAAPAMQSQIPPATQPPTYYLCPATS